MKSQNGNYGAGFRIKCMKVIQVNDSSAYDVHWVNIKLPIYGFQHFGSYVSKQFRFHFICFKYFTSQNSKDIDLVSI